MTETTDTSTEGTKSTNSHTTNPYVKYAEYDKISVLTTATPGSLSVGFFAKTVMSVSGTSKITLSFSKKPSST